MINCLVLATDEHRLAQIKRFAQGFHGKGDLPQSGNMERLSNEEDILATGRKKKRLLQIELLEALEG